MKTKKVFILDGNMAIPLYFSTAKKVHSYLIDNGYTVHKNFSVFNRWLTQSGNYELKDIGQVYFMPLN